MSSNSIQFRGRDSVVKAFDNRSVEAWAIFQGKQFMFKGVGSEELDNILGMLSESTNAIYTLCVYEEIEDAKSIKHNSAHDGSFNFRLNEGSQEITAAQYGSYNKYEDLKKELAGIRDLIESRDDEKDEEPNAIGGTIGAILNHPTLAPIVSGVLQNLLDKLLNPAGSTAPLTPLIAAPAPFGVNMSAVGNIAADAELNTALQTLKAKDPELTKHLKKLAWIACNDPAGWSLILSTLNSYPNGH